MCVCVSVCREREKEDIKSGLTETAVLDTFPGSQPKLRTTQILM
jgi:hypothetical protein